MNQHKSNTGKDESAQVQHESTRINTNLKQVQITKNRMNMAKPNQWTFREKYVKGCIGQWFKSFSPVYLQLYHKILLFYKGVYFVKDHTIVTCNNDYATVSHYIKGSILKPIIES